MTNSGRTKPLSEMAPPVSRMKVATGKITNRKIAFSRLNGSEAISIGIVPMANMANTTLTRQYSAAG